MRLGVGGGRERCPDVGRLIEASALVGVRRAELEGEAERARARRFVRFVLTFINRRSKQLENKYTYRMGHVYAQEVGQALRNSHVCTFINLARGIFTAQRYLRSAASMRSQTSN